MQELVKASDVQVVYDEDFVEYTKPDFSDLDDVISMIKNTGFSKCVSHPNLLIRSVEEFRDLIGNDKVKDSVANSMIDLMVSIQRLGLENVMRDQMTHTVFYGPPGVGKTLLGTKLAKIWYSLGILKRRSESKVEYDLEDLLNSPSSQVNPFVSILLGSAIIYGLFWLYGKVVSIYNDPSNSTWDIAMALGVAVIGSVLIYWVYSSLLPSDEIDVNVNNDREIVRVVSKEDLVAGYVGQTAIKTKKLLEKSVGKVLVIDEAYSLLPDGGLTNDQFGMEALDVINRFMSERAGEIIIIFCGYKKGIKRLFDAQKGLERRFPWKFTCDGYTPSQLFQIFKQQASQLRYGLTDEVEIEKLFIQNSNCFPNFGGDTKNLLMFAKQEHSRDYARGLVDEINKLYPLHIKKGINKLVENTDK